MRADNGQENHLLLDRQSATGYRRLRRRWRRYFAGRARSPPTATRASTRRSQGFLFHLRTGPYPPSRADRRPRGRHALSVAWFAFRHAGQAGRTCRDRQPPLLRRHRGSSCRWRNALRVDGAGRRGRTDRGVAGGPGHQHRRPDRSADADVPHEYWRPNGSATDTHSQNDVRGRAVPWRFGEGESAHLLPPGRAGGRGRLVPKWRLVAAGRCRAASR